MDADNQKRLDLERDIFGEGSDLSSDEGSEEERVVQPKKPQPKPQRKRVQVPREDDESSADSAAEDYVQEKPPKSKKRKPKAALGDEEAPKRKRKKKVASPQPDVPLTQEEERRLRVDQTIKDVLKNPKRAKKRTKQNEDVLDKIADDFVLLLREDMIIAAKEDKHAHKEGLPAFSKIRMLDRVMDTLQKRQYATSVMDQDLLGACKIWLEPLDNKSLPALNIQNALFKHFLKMNIDTETLRESGLGRVVLFYTKCKRVIEPIQRIASQLVDTWTRPILKRSASYRDKVVPVASAQDMESVRVQMPKLNAILSRAREEEVGRTIRKNAVAIPERNMTTYTVAPKFSTSLLSRNPHDEALQARKNNKEMLKRLQKRNEKTGKA